MALALDGSAIGNATATTVAVTLTTTGPGLVFVTFASNAAVSSVTAPGLTFTQVSGLPYNNSTSNFVDIWWAVSAGALSSKVITGNMSSSTFVTPIAFGISGADTVSPFDGAVVTNSGTSIQISTSNANTFIFAVEVDNNTTVGSGFTQLQSSTNFNFSDYKIVSTTQTNLVCGTQNASASKQWAAIAVKQASGGGGFIPAWAIPSNIPVIGTGTV